MIGVAVETRERPAMGALNAGRLVQAVVQGRKDSLVIDCARLVATHYGRLVESLSEIERQPLSAHNNKTLFLEGIDLWCRALFSPAARSGGGRTSDPREVVAHVMEPWYEAMELEDPSRYRLGKRPPPPLYVGSPEEAQTFMLSMCAALDITPIHLRFGLRGGKPERMWGVVQADGKWYDTDISEASFVLGDHPKFPDYQDVEVPL